MGRKPSESQDKFIVRLPDGMRDALKLAAEANNRTMTAEVVARLKSTLENDEAFQPKGSAPTSNLTVVSTELNEILGRLTSLQDDIQALRSEIKGPE